MKERILFECVGQCGGNIGQLLMNKGFICHFINTSNDDLNSIKVRDDFKYHIPNAMGCNKDRKKALYFAKDYYEHITSVIDNGFPRQDIVFFVFSLGGGTGSGISPAMIDYLAKRNPHKHYGAVVILPSTNEPIKAHVNAIECYNQLKNIELLKNVFVLDNGYADRFDVNIEFVEAFDRLMNITTPDNRGVIDGAELETLLTCKGRTVMGTVELNNVISFNSSVFAPFVKGCQYIAVSAYDEFNYPVTERLFGTPMDMFIGYNSNDNFVVCSGLSLYTKRIEELADKAKERQSLRETAFDDYTFDIPIIEKKRQRIDEKQIPQKVSFDDVFNKFLD